MNEQKEAARPRGTDSAKVIQVIVTEALEGVGTESDPCRVQRRYWSLDGELLATEPIVTTDMAGVSPEDLIRSIVHDEFCSQSRELMVDPEAFSRAICDRGQEAKSPLLFGGGDGEGYPKGGD